MCLAIPGQVVELMVVEGLFREARVDFSGTCRQVNLTCTPEAQIGDYVLVHSGIAICVLQTDEAQRTLRALAELELLESEMDEESAP